MLDLLRSSLNRVQHDPALRRAEGVRSLHLPDALPTVEGDPLLLSQVWDNLLGNAFKPSRPRRPASSPSVPNGGPARTAPRKTWVRDNGVGFDAAQAERLFGVFQRLHRAQDFEAQALAWPCAGASSSATAGASGPMAAPAKGPPSPSPCRCSARRGPDHGGRLP